MRALELHVLHRARLRTPQASVGAQHPVLEALVADLVRVAFCHARRERPAILRRHELERCCARRARPAARGRATRASPRSPTPSMPPRWISTPSGKPLDQLAQLVARRAQRLEALLELGLLARDAAKRVADREHRAAAPPQPRRDRVRLGQRSSSRPRRPPRPAPRLATVADRAAAAARSRWRDTAGYTLPTRDSRRRASPVDGEAGPTAATSASP